MAMTLVFEAKAQNAQDMPKSTRAEAGILARTEYGRMLALLETLEGDDWQQPTYCTEWNVRDMVAHLAGAVTGSSSFAEFKRQNISHPYVREAANSVDGTNRLQIEERAEIPPDELIAEFRRNGPVAIKNRQKLPWLIRQIPVPGVNGNFEYLMDVIYTRDQWMHRYDICAATGKEMVVTPEHDGRLAALVLRDIGQKLKKGLAKRRVDLHLTGALVDTCQFGGQTEPDCAITLDLFTFNLRASERISLDEVLQVAHVTGDESAARWFLTNATVLY